MKKYLVLLTPLALFAAPQAPTNLILTPHINSVSLSWQDNASTEKGYKIFRDAIMIATLPKNITHYEDEGLIPHTTYHYRIVATDDDIWYQPESNTSWQWQLSEDINLNYDVDLYDIDLFDTSTSTIQTLHQQGKKVICYFNAGAYEPWRDDADTFPPALLGNSVEGWEEEKWLDIQASGLRPIMIARLDVAKQKGCDGVEPDNVDGYENDTGFALTPADQKEYNLFLAKEAHKRGLSIGLKNDLPQVKELEPYFDFAVNEECHTHFYQEDNPDEVDNLLDNECKYLNPFIYTNKAVFNAEYNASYVNNTNGARDTLCQDSHVLGFQTLVLPEALDDSFRYACHPPQANSALLFASGFEGAVSLEDLIADGYSGYQNITGEDSQTHFTWPINIRGASESALHYIEYLDANNQAILENRIETIIGHDGTTTKALYSEEKSAAPDSVTQSPYEILNIPEADGRKDLYIRYWIKLDGDSLYQPDMWRTFFEYKTKGYGTGSGFRLISYIYMNQDGSGEPYWHFQGDTYVGDEANGTTSYLWSIDNRDIPIPKDRWFLTEFYWHWSEGDDGRALWKIDGKVVAYHHGRTTINHQPLDFIMLTQIYGNANPKYQWIDDIEIWGGWHD